METTLYTFDIKKRPSLTHRRKWLFRLLLPLLVVGSFASCTKETVEPMPLVADGAAERSQSPVLTAIVTVHPAECVPSAYNGMLFRIDNTWGDYLQPYYTTGNYTIAVDEQYEITYKREAVAIPFPGHSPDTIYCLGTPPDMESCQPIKVLQLRRL